MTVTSDDLRRLRNMLGVDQDRPKSKWGYRNYFAGAPGESTESMRRLESAGFVRQGEPYAKSYYFHATKEGCKAAGLNPTQIEAIGESA